MKRCQCPCEMYAGVSAMTMEPKEVVLPKFTIDMSETSINWKHKQPKYVIITDNNEQCSIESLPPSENFIWHIDSKTFMPGTKAVGIYLTNTLQCSFSGSDSAPVGVSFDLGTVRVLHSYFNFLPKNSSNRRTIPLDDFTGFYHFVEPF